jgi:hypothetical protein
MSEPQLERSVLEAKEREELFAIANALGTGPISRARKSDLVNQILQATGVEVPDAAKEVPERPRRTRAKKAVTPDPESLSAVPAQSTLALTSSVPSGTEDATSATAEAVAAPAPSRSSARSSVVRAATPRAAGAAGLRRSVASDAPEVGSDASDGPGRNDAGDSSTGVGAWRDRR